MKWKKLYGKRAEIEERNGRVNERNEKDTSLRGADRSEYRRTGHHHELGIGSCWIHRAKEEFESAEGKEILKSFGITGEYEGVGHCVLGYVDGAYPEAKARKENWVYRIQ